MSLSRRTFLAAVLAASALPLQARADTGVVVYKGPDDPAAFQSFLEKESRDAVVVNVFHAKWCGPCHTLFGQLASIRQQPGQAFKVVGLDVGPPAFQSGPYQNIVKAYKVRATPTMEVFADGNKQFATLGFIQDVPDVSRYLFELNAAVKGTGSPQVRAPRPQ